MKNRDPGFYWCLYRGHWGVFMWDEISESFLYPGIETFFYEHEFDQIDERKIENPNENISL